MKYIKKSHMFFVSAMAFMMTLFVPAVSYATTTPPDFTPLTDAFSPTTIITPILAIAAILATVYVAIKGAKTIISMIRGG